MTPAWPDEGGLYGLFAGVFRTDDATIGFHNS